MWGFQVVPFPLGTKHRHLVKTELRVLDCPHTKTFEEMNETSYMSLTHIIRARFDQIEPIGHTRVSRV